MINKYTETTLQGKLEHITFYNEETHYLIARLRPKETNSSVSVLGYMPAPNLGETLKVSGVWHFHPRYGQQFKFETFEVLLPNTISEISTYLKSGFIKGIGPKTVAHLIAEFKDQTIDIIENHPDELTKVKGIGKKTAKRITKEWKTHHATRSLMRFLKKNDIKPLYGAKLMRLYGDKAEKILKDEPFRVAADLPRIGFQIADQIIQRSDMIVDPKERALACLRYLIDQAVYDGHVFEFKNRLLAKALTMFQIDDQSGHNAILQLKENNEIVVDPIVSTKGGPAVYPFDLYLAETTIANRLSTALCIPNPIPHIDSEKIDSVVLKQMALKLSEQQQHVLIKSISQKTAIITGGPGTGKTTLIRSIAAVLEYMNLRILLAAPTGRSARRISEVTRRPAVTLHKLLGFCIKGGDFKKDQDDPLDADAIIIDEASMVDTTLFFHLIKAVPLTSILILVGDVFQLPSIGSGNVLSDLIQSGKIVTFELTEIFRNANESSIVANAHRIRNGQMLKRLNPTQEDLTDFYFIEEGRPEVVVNTIVRLCTKEIPNRFFLHPKKQIQVLTPMHKGVVGTLNLNRILQGHLNPQRQKIKFLEGNFRLKDKVMHLRNNYQKEVFNGDIGTIVDIDIDAEEILVDYYGKQVPYNHTELDELTLAYAISIHKSQGSEYPAVIVPILTQHYALLQRNLLYTAVTRAKQLVFLIGPTKALAIALGNDNPCRRQTGLTERLVSAIPS
jgi:exodeoxyribonuclease V alpha subunit